MRNAGLEEAQGGIKIAGRNINNLRYADDTTLMAESEEELKSLLMKGGEKGLRGGGAGKPQCSSRGRPGFLGTLWVASREPSALSTSNS